MAAERVRSIDIAKGIGILLIAIAHSHILNIVGTDVNHALGTMRVPLFFFLSGMFFKAPGGLLPLLARKADSLLKPYFITLILALSVGASVGKEKAWSFLGILYGVGSTVKWVPLWFFPHLWALFLFGWLFFKITNYSLRASVTKFAFLALLWFSGLLSMNASLDSFPVSLGGLHGVVGLPFSLDFVLMSSVYFILGFTLRDGLRNFGINRGLVVLSALLFLSSNLVFHPVLNFNERLYTQPLASAAASFSGIYLALALARTIDRLRPLNFLAGALAYTGTTSLYILLFHQFIDIRLYGLLTSSHLSLGPTAASVASYATCVTFPMVIGEAIRRNRILSLLYLPLK